MAEKKLKRIGQVCFFAIDSKLCYSARYSTNSD
jgi:hypothetical protein